MKKNIVKTVTTTYDEEGNILDTNEVTTTVLIPDENSYFRHKITGKVIKASQIGVGTDDDIDNYEELTSNK